MRHLAATFVIALTSALFTGPAHAELGDYSAFRTLLNLVNPPAPDNPVTEADQQGPYPLIVNPDGYDNFSPGNYYAWQTIELAPETGAVCGNGSPYKFFVNRVPNTSNTIVYFEGGGACWDYESCSGSFGIRGARNPDGIPDDYMSLLNPGASLVSPFVVRAHPWTRVKTQNWNMVYVPYCTGDIYSGDTVAIYDDPAGEAEPLVWHHNGIRNTRATVAWMKDNLQRSGQMLATGCSAGGAGSFTNYYTTRRDLGPTRGYLINDSGPVFTAPADGDPVEYPSLPLQQHIRTAWGLDAPNGPLDYIASELPLLDLDNLGTLYPALSAALPGDRIGHTHFWDDMNYSSYSYERFFDEINDEPDPAVREALILERWHADTSRMTSELANLDNVGYYLPRYRAVNESHCTSIIEFANADIQELGLELDHFVTNVMEGSGTVMQASETDTQIDRQKPFNLLYYLVDQLL